MAGHRPIGKLLHERLGHPGIGRFKWMMKQMGILMKNEDAEMIEKLHEKCETCMQAKSVKKQNHKTVPRAKEPLRRVYMDFWGPYYWALNKHR